jgi:hypothetical protein
VAAGRSTILCGKIMDWAGFGLPMDHGEVETNLKPVFLPEVRQKAVFSFRSRLRVGLRYGNLGN